MAEISKIGNLLISWSNPSVESLIEDRIWVAIEFFVFFSALVAVVLIVAAGYMFITSAGDPEKVDKARKALTAAIVGMVIVFLARLIVGFIINIADDEEAKLPEKKVVVDFPPTV